MILTIRSPVVHDNEVAGVLEGKGGRLSAAAIGHPNQEQIASWREKVS